jgi:hypothetical protein
MTTAAEKVALDVMFAALDGCAKGDPSKQLTMLFGIVAHVCHEHGIPEDLAKDFLRNRWREYRLRFEHHDA